ncbi:MAG: Cell division protein FtsZ 1 [Methanonatronarchaeales archaeon]|nr:Cell division protein FtsZ 1 [Methanonatronarchaeales archaeon]
MELESIISEALEHSEEEKDFRESVEEQLDSFGKPQILIVGCGGAGNNTVNRIHNIGIRGAETIAVNTDKQHLDIVKADKKLLIGKSLTQGLGAGGHPDVGRRAAELGRDALEDVLSGSDLVFVTAGMGGGTGTGVAPVVAEVAKDHGAIVVGMVSTPFHVERARMKKAEQGLDDVKKISDTVIVLDNNRLLNYVPNLPIEQAFSVMDQLIAQTVKGLSETITQPSLINLDYADIKTVMSQGGLSVMLVGETNEQEKSSSVVKEALSHPLLDVSYDGATGALVHITGGTDLTLKEAEEIANQLTYEMESSANMIWGARISEGHEGKVRVVAIMTGVESAQILSNQQMEASGSQVNESALNLDVIR